MKDRLMLAACLLYMAMVSLAVADALLGSIL